jgi:hypothetical protein
VNRSLLQISATYLLNRLVFSVCSPSRNIVQGDLIFKFGGKERRAGVGEHLVVQKGTPQTFRCVGDRYGVTIVETRPAARTGEVIATLFGMAHEGALTPQGQSRFLQAVVIGSEYVRLRNLWDKKDTLMSISLCYLCVRETITPQSHHITSIKSGAIA